MFALWEDVAGSGAQRLEIYRCGKINVDIEPQYGWQNPRAYMWLEWETFGMRSASERCGNA